MHGKTYRVCLFLVLSVVYTMVFAQGVVMTVVANDLMLEMHLTPSRMGLLGSVYLYTYAGVMLFSGMFAAWPGPRYTLSGLFLISGIGGLILASSGSFSGAVVGRALSGIGMAATMTTTFTLLSRWYPPESYSRLCSFYFAVGGSGTFFATSLLPHLDEAWGWRGVFYFLAATTLVFSAALFLVVRDWPPREDGAPGGGAGGLTAAKLIDGIRMVIKRPDLWRLATWFFCVTGCYYAFPGLWAIPYLRDVYGLSPARAGSIVSVFAVGFIAGTPIVTWFCDRVARTYRGGLGVSGLLTFAGTGFLVLNIDSLSVPALYVLMLVFGVIMNSPGTLGYSAAKNLFGTDMVGVTGGVFAAGTFLGGAVLQVVCGALLDYARDLGWAIGPSYAFAFMPFLLAGLVAAVAGFTLSRESYREPEKR